jgi:putative endonuclease
MESQSTHSIFYTYVLQSEDTGVLYIGYTSDIERRLREHNEAKGKYTSNKGNWNILFYKKFINKHDAISLERQLKRWKSKTRVLEWIERERNTIDK